MSAAIPVPLRSPRDGATQPAEIVAFDLHRRAERQAIDDVAEARLTLGRIDDLMAAEADFAGMLDRAAFPEALEILRGVVALTRTPDPKWRRVYLDSAQSLLRQLVRAYAEDIAGQRPPTFDNSEDPA